VPALPLDEAGAYVSGAYAIFVTVLASYVAVMSRHVRRALAELDELSQRLADRRDD
jgi:hypothetical protein